MLIPVFTCDCMYVPHGSMIFGCKINKTYGGNKSICFANKSIQNRSVNDPDGGEAVRLNYDLLCKHIIKYTESKLAQDSYMCLQST